MKTDTLLQILYLLSKSSEGKEKELATLYERLLNEHEDYVKLKTFLGKTVFYDDKGETILRKAEELIRSANENPKEIMDILDQIKAINVEIQSNLTASDRIMQSKEIVQDRVFIIDKEKQDVYEEVLDSVVKAAVYLLCISSEYKLIQSLEWGKDYSIYQKQDLLNSSYLPRLEKAASTIFAWQIVKKKNEEEIRFVDFNYHLERIPLWKFQEYVNGKIYKKIRDNLYYDKNADENGFYSVPIYVGMGNVISRNRDDIFNIMTIYNDDVKDLDRELFNNPPTCIDQIMRELCTAREYIISPKKVVSVLNQWEQGYTITYRKNESRCLFCGKFLRGGNMICDGHINFQR